MNTCLRCHSLSVATHASICPINAKSDCVRCHMPSVEANGFHLTDHWIAVHPDQGIQAGPRDDRLRSLVTPKSEYLQILVTENQAGADAARARLAKGDSFYDVAHDISIDATAPGGGFIGEMPLSEMDSRLAGAAAKLSYGETTGVIDEGNRFVMLHRLPRDFKWEASQLYDKAVAARAHGDLKGALQADQVALKVYPYFLRALNFMGTAMAEGGNTARASEILSFAVQSYPQDASAQFNLALTLGKQPASQIEALRRTIELDQDMVPAYESLGAALASSGQMANAIEVFRRGLTIDPLSAILNYDLGLALQQQGDEAGAKQALALAAKLDPQIAARSAKGQ